MRSFDSRLGDLATLLRRRPGQAYLLEAAPTQLDGALQAVRAALLCPHDPPCGQCWACGTEPHPDWQEVGPAGSRAIGRDAVKGWPEQALVPATVAAVRVFVVREAHRLTPEAGNLLLKLVEEPPRHVVVVLTSDGLHPVLPTLRSRCRWIPIRGEQREADASVLDTETWEDSDWADRLPAAAEALRAEVLAGAEGRHLAQCLARWEALVTAALALEQNANREIVRRRLVAAYQRHGA
jgi:DNA polymerase-3 subunit delta'